MEGSELGPNAAGLRLAPGRYAEVNVRRGHWLRWHHEPQVLQPPGGVGAGACQHLKGRIEAVVTIERGYPEAPM